VAAGAGLIATGSRGPWLAAAVGVLVTVGAIAIRRPDRRARLGVLALLGVVAAGGAWVLGGSMIKERFANLQRDVQTAEQKDDLITDTGIRVFRWTAAWRTFQADPIVGVGAGGFEAAARQQPEFKQAQIDRPKTARRLVRGHAHSTYLHTLATTGAIGGVLLALVMLVTLRAAWRNRLDHPWADGSLGVLIAWLVGAQFDCYQLNGHYFGLFAFLAAVTLPWRPPQIGVGRWATMPVRRGGDGA